MLLAFAVTGGAALAGVWAWWSRRDQNPKVCDLRRCIVIIGDSQNDDDCIRQRISLKPHLMMVRDARINVIEMYGRGLPRRNGKNLEWAENKHLRRTLHTEAGFHFMCIDDDGEIAMRVRMPVSAYVIEELIAGSTHSALPSPDENASEGDTTSDVSNPTVANNDSEDSTEGEQPKRTFGSVGVLR